MSFQLFKHDLECLHIDHRADSIHIENSARKEKTSNRKLFLNYKKDVR